MKNFFKPEDFYYGDAMARVSDEVAKLANEKLNKLIESWPVVYGNNFISNDGSAFDIGSVWNITKLNDKTHKARLAFIEKIVKEPCPGHEPQIFRNTWNDTGPRYIFDSESLKCQHCGVELVAKWSPK